jgi:hypothetical protein
VNEAMNHEEAVRWIDSKSYGELLLFWRSTPYGHPMLRGYLGNYFFDRLRELKPKPKGTT